MRPTKQSRRGFSLIEVTIALAMFAAMMVALLQSMITLSGYAAQESGMSDVATMGRMAITQITNDIANTAWFYNYDQGNHLFFSPLTPLYPNVTKSLVTTTNPDGSTSTNEMDSIEFIKIRTSTNVANSPNDEHYSTLSFFNYNSGPVPPAVVTLDQYNIGTGPTTTTSTPMLVVNPNYPQAAGAYDILVSHVWESPNTNLSFDANMDPNQLRHTKLEVITNSQGIQQLVRNYCNPSPGGGGVPPEVNGNWSPDDRVVLMDYVQSFAINTQQNTLGTTNNIQANQITFTITVNRPEPTNPTAYTKSTFNIYASMRSVSH